MYSRDTNTAAEWRSPHYLPSEAVLQSNCYFGSLVHCLPRWKVQRPTSIHPLQKNARQKMYSICTSDSVRTQEHAYTNYTCSWVLTESKTGVAYHCPS